MSDFEAWQDAKDIQTMADDYTAISEREDAMLDSYGLACNAALITGVFPTWADHCKGLAVTDDQKDVSTSKLVDSMAESIFEYTKLCVAGIKVGHIPTVDEFKTAQFAAACAVLFGDEDEDENESSNPLQ